MADVEVFAPTAQRVRLRYHDTSESAETAETSETGETVETAEMMRRGEHWVGEVPDGARYQVVVDGGPGLVDPAATRVWFADGHTRDHPDAWAVAAPWPAARPPRWTTRPPMVYEVHVRGFTKRRPRPDAGTFAALIAELPRLAEIGVSVLELLPVHQFDAAEGNYWGYMPLVFGAVHGAYGADVDAAAELADLVTAAHDHDIEVWLDVVVNHTTEEDEHGPTFNLRALADDCFYALDDAGRYVNDAGCGNIVDATSAPARRLIMSGLERLADLGVDGFRFDLAAVLAREPDFVRSIGDWADRRGVRLIAEPWDLRRYLLGRAFPDERWMQWNGRFRDDMRGFLRGEGGLVAAVMQRLQGSPDLFDTPSSSVNFLTAHDGFTMYDLVAYDHKHNAANGWNGTDGTDDNRSWNCGWEGDDGVPQHVMELRRRQLRNAATLLLLSAGTPMLVGGDEFGRTQGGNNNPYNQDNETSWVDWGRRSDFVDHERFVRDLIDVRSEFAGLFDGSSWGERVEWYGTTGPPDLAAHSRSLAWHVADGGDELYVLANMWWESLEFDVQAPGPWRLLVDTTPGVVMSDTTPHPEAAVGPRVEVGPRSVVVLRRTV